MNVRLLMNISSSHIIHRSLIYKNAPICFKNLLRRYSINAGAVKQAEKLSHSFGYEQVTPSEKREKVQAVFSEVAEKYDLMNDVMSLGIHRFWKDYFINTLSPTPGMKLLDVAGGTGDIAFRFLEASLESHSKNLELTSELLESEETQPEDASHVTVLDLNDKMLEICKNKAKDAGFKKCKYLGFFVMACIQGNAEKLPFDDNSFDAYTIAFGIRNVVHIDQALTEALRVLRPGGRFLCLEFSQVQTPTLYRLYDWYSQEIIPVLGQVVAGNWKAYQYLVDSIQRFPNQEEFETMITEAGFKHVNYINLSNGIAAIHSGYKL